MRTLAIGDVHGCYRALSALMEAVRPGVDDRLVFLGDYVDRGPDSKKVVQWLIDRKSDHDLVCLRGNHEIMMLEARVDPLQCHFWSSVGGLETLISYDAEQGFDWTQRIPSSHWEFMESTEQYFETADDIYVHAMVRHDLPLSDQDAQALFWGRCYGMKPHRSGKRVICGHTPQESMKPGLYDFGICLDTGAYANGWLTCLDVDSNHYWQANETGEAREGKLVSP